MTATYGTSLATLPRADAGSAGDGPKLHLGSVAGLPAEAELRGDQHQLRGGVRLEVLHDPRAVELDRLLDDAEVRGDLLVQLPLCEPLEHLALARRERREARAQRG